MRRRHLFLLAILALAIPAATSTAEEAPDSPEALARRVLAALKADDPSSLAATLPTEADVTWVLEQVGRNGTSEEASRARASVEARGGVGAIVEATRKTASARFAKARQEGGKEIDWADVRFDAISTRKNEMSGVESMTIALHVVSRGARYRLEIRDAGRVARGWLAPEGVRYVRCIGCLTPDAAARRTFEALRRYDYQAFLVLVPLRSDLAEPPEGKAPAGPELDRRVLRTLQANKQGFETAFAAARGKIDWNKARYGGVDEKGTRITPAGNGKRGDIRFRVRVGETAYVFRLPDAVRNARGWMVSDGPRYEGRADD